jgi:hypothetical protein
MRHELCVAAVARERCLDPRGRRVHVVDGQLKLILLAQDLEASSIMALPVPLNNDHAHVCGRQSFR